MAATVLVVLVDWPALADRLGPPGRGEEAPGPVPVQERR
jgi:hypothetical protein